MFPTRGISLTLALVGNGTFALQEMAVAILFVECIHIHMYKYIYIYLFFSESLDRLGKFVQ